MWSAMSSFGLFVMVQTISSSLANGTANGFPDNVSAWEVQNDQRSTVNPRKYYISPVGNCHNLARELRRLFQQVSTISKHQDKIPNDYCDDLWKLVDFGRLCRQDDADLIEAILQWKDSPFCRHVTDDIEVRESHISRGGRIYRPGLAAHVLLIGLMFVNLLALRIKD